MAQQQIITKPYVEELQDNDSLFINHDGALRQIKKSSADFASGADMRAEVAAREAFETSVGEQIAEKANIDGYYEEMTVGDAEQLVATQFVEDNKPYLFRSTGGSSDVGNRAYLDKIVGGTVVWNQLVQNGDFATDGYWSSYTDEYATYTRENKTGKIVVNSVPKDAVQVMMQNYDNNSEAYLPEAVVGHKYLFSADVKVSESISMKAYNSNNGSLANKLCSANEWTTIIGINEAARKTMYMCILPSYLDDIKVGLTFYAKNAFNIDLTKMFGSTIADYIYSLEQATAGAGVSWFKKLFPKDYYPYNTGELLSVEGLQSHDTVGFNQFDKNSMVVEGVYIDDANGAEESRAAAVSTDFIQVIPNATYFINTGQTTGGWGAWYDANKNYISGITGYANVDPTYKVKTAPSNAHYMRLTIRYNSNGNPDTLCINLSNPSRNGEYEPYTKHSYPLDSSLTLRGIPKLDASNNLYYDGDEYTSDGEVKRKYGVVDLGTLDWVQHATSRFYATLPYKASIKSSYNDYTNIICANYERKTLNELFESNKGISTHPLQGTSVWIYDSDYTDATAFKAAMSGVMLVYELAAPTTETVEPFQHIQIVDDFGTEEFVNTGIVPVGHNTRYHANLRDKLQHLPSLASADGTYMIQQAGKQMSLIHMPAVFPDTPTEDGTYTLKTVVTGGVTTLQWVAE